MSRTGAEEEAASLEDAARGTLWLCEQLAMHGPLNLFGVARKVRSHLQGVARDEDGAVTFPRDGGCTLVHAFRCVSKSVVLFLYIYIHVFLFKMFLC